MILVASSCLELTGNFEQVVTCIDFFNLKGLELVNFRRNLWIQKESLGTWTVRLLTLSILMLMVSKTQYFLVLNAFLSQE